MDTEPGASSSVGTNALRKIADRLAEKIAGDRIPEQVTFTPSLAHILDRADASIAVVGRPGAGKTLLVEQAELLMLAQRSPGGPVAVRVPVEQWHTGKPVLEWLAAFLTTRYSVRRKEAKALVSAGLVHPLVDGVDELAVGVRPTFLQELRALPFPVVLTSRSEDVGQWFPTIVLQSPSADARLYRWPVIAEAMRRHPSGPLAVALADPVNLYMFKSVYTAGGSDPSMLLDRSRFPDSASVERYLSTELAPDTLQKLRKLAYYARLPDPRVAWWRLHEATPAESLTVVALLAGVAAAGLSFSGVSGLVSIVTSSVSMREVLDIVATSLVVALALVAGRFVGTAGASRRPVALDWSRWRLSTMWWMAASTATGGVVGAMGMLLGRGWSTLSHALLVGAGAGVLKALSILTVVRADDNHLDHPMHVLSQDAVAAFARLVATAISLGFLLSALLGTTDNRSGVAFVLLVVAALAVSRSAFFRYKVAAWAPQSGRYMGNAVSTLLAVPELVRPDGGTFVFQDESVRRRLAEIRLDPKHLTSVRSATEQVSSLRQTLAKAACEQADVAGVLDHDRVQQFVDDVAANIDHQAATIAASAAEPRRQYATAKARYAKSLLRMPLQTATAVTAFTTTLPKAGWFLVTFAATAATLQHIGVKGTHAVLSLLALWLIWRSVRWAAHQLGGKELRNISNSTTAGIIAALVIAALDQTASWTAPAWIALTTGPAALGLWCWLVWILTARLRSRTMKLWSDTPEHWPPADIAQRASVPRAKAQQAHGEWLEALRTCIVRDVVVARLETAAQRSYDKVLPAAELHRLGDVTEVADYVPTAISRHLERTMKSMKQGAIGISGPRGVGKSTLLTLFGDLGLAARDDDLALVVPAPTTYAARDFVVHLYTRLCTKVIKADPVSRPRPKRWPWLLVSLTGVLAAIAAWQWPHLARAAAWVPSNWQTVVIIAGAAAAVAPLLTLWAATTWLRRDLPKPILEEEARRRLAGLRYVQTTTVTRNAAVKPPMMAEFSGSHALAQASQAKTFPELVDELRRFLADLTDGKTDARVIVAVDELDKIGSAEEAERFLNDIKAIFGVSRTFFLVAVSDDALASFSRRSLAVRTAFDSAFDTVVTVDRFTLADTRRLLVQRVSRLPEPFVWLCHVLSGGLPRDLNRTVRELYDARTADPRQDLGELTRCLVRVDLTAVTGGLTARLADRFDAPALRLRQHILNARQREMTSTALRDHQQSAPTAGASDDLLFVYSQFHSYLLYAAAVLSAFRENADAMIAALKKDKHAEHVELLARAREWLAVDPVAAAAHVEEWRVQTASFPAPSSPHADHGA